MATNGALTGGGDDFATMIGAAGMGAGRAAAIALLPVLAGGLAVAGAPVLARTGRLEILTPSPAVSGCVDPGSRAEGFWAIAGTTTSFSDDE